MSFQLQKFGSVEYNSLSLTERSFLLASCFGKYSILHLFSCLLYPLTNSCHFSPSNIDWISVAENVADGDDDEDKDIEDEEGVLPTCANISSSSCLEYHTWTKIALFLSNQIYLKVSKQCEYIRVLSYTDSKNSPVKCKILKCPN